MADGIHVPAPPFARVLRALLAVSLRSALRMPAPERPEPAVILQCGFGWCIGLGGGNIACSILR